MSMRLLLTRTTTEVKDGLFRPIVSSLTIDQAGAFLAAHAAELPLYVGAQFNVVDADGVPPVAQQIAVKLRRLAAIGRKCGRVVCPVSVRREGAIVYADLVK